MTCQELGPPDLRGEKKYGYPILFLLGFIIIVFTVLSILVGEPSPKKVGKQVGTTGGPGGA